jgi:hypothetical protein
LPILTTKIDIVIIMCFKVDQIISLAIK